MAGSLGGFSKARNLEFWREGTWDTELNVFMCALNLPIDPAAVRLTSFSAVP